MHELNQIALKIISDGKSINKMTLEEMDKYWECSKKT